jgi:hypothetical protein
MHLKMLAMCLLGSATALTLQLQLACATPQPDRDPEIERSLTYKYCFNRLTGLAGESPFGIAIDPNGAGHLQASGYQSSKVFGSVPISLSWDDRIGFLDPNTNKWKPLTWTDATSFWGTPHKHLVGGRAFSTFDVKSVKLKRVLDEPIDEENLYHLDLSFNDRGIIFAYRIRGIGVSNPEWISADWVPKK